MPPPRLPAELLDHIVDHLHDNRPTQELQPRLQILGPTYAKAPLRQCRVPHRKPGITESNISESFHHSCALHEKIGDLVLQGSCSRRCRGAFLRAVHFDLDFNNPTVSLLPLHGFSPALKSLHVEYGTFPFPRILNLINSFPLLEDLWLMVWGGDPVGDVDTQPAVVQKVQPPLTGSLKLGAQEGMNRIVSQLFPPQNGLQFRRLDLKLMPKTTFSRYRRWWRGAVLPLNLSRSMLDTTVCPFDFLSIPISHSADEGSSGSIDLSKATGLKDVALKWKKSPQWVAKTLRTITHNHRSFQQVSFALRQNYYFGYYTAKNPTNLRKLIGRTICPGWLELDDALVQLWKSHSIRLEPVYVVLMEGKVEGGCWVGSLLPEATARGLVRLVEQYILRVVSQRAEHRSLRRKLWARESGCHP